MLSKTGQAFLWTILIMLFFASVASAHVNVKPSESTVGAWETYTVNVPNEKEIPTTKITLKIPKGMEFEHYQPVPGWTFSSEKEAEKVKSITYKASGSGILPGQFQQFKFVIKNPDKPEKAAWDAYQYYKDGSIVEWVGDETTATPHSITTIMAASSTNTTNGDNETNTNMNPTQTSNQVRVQPTEAMKMVVVYLALILSVVALLVSLVRRKA